MKEIINGNYKYSELTGKIIGCCIEVHKILGNGFQEVIYQRALEEEFLLKGVSVQREYEMNIFYKGKLVGTRRIDFLVDKAVSLEIKALVRLEDVHLAQAINYLEVHDLEIGMLINFGSKSLEYKRLINPKFGMAHPMHQFNQ